MVRIRRFFSCAAADRHRQSRAKYREWGSRYCSARHAQSEGLDLRNYEQGRDWEKPLAHHPRHFCIAGDFHHAATSIEKTGCRAFLFVSCDWSNSIELLPAHTGFDRAFASARPDVGLSPFHAEASALAFLYRAAALGDDRAKRDLFAGPAGYRPAVRHLAGSQDLLLTNFKIRFVWSLGEIYRPILEPSFSNLALCRVPNQSEQ